MPEESFDSFYVSTRRAVLHQTFALTGDLPASQSAVRDAYVAAWHHWRKVAPLEDRVAWVRPLAFNHAQRRHAGKIWHRNKGVTAEQQQTLDALATVSSVRRRVLVLVQLAGVSLANAAREVGVTQQLAEQHLQTATATLTTELDTDPVSLRAALESLDGPAVDAPLPRASIIRRAGRKRRQVHTVGAILAASLVAVTSGWVAYEPGAAATGPGRVERPGTAIATERPDRGEQMPTADNLLDQDQIRRLGQSQAWEVADTHNNTRGDGINSRCQQSRFADEDGRAAIVREFRGLGKQRRGAVQTVEVSKSASQAHDGYRTTLGWYAGCRVGRLQLLDAYRVDNIGDEASVLMMKVWGRPSTTYSVAVARIGAVTTSTVGRSVGVSPPPAGEITQSLADAVSMLCARSGATDCAKAPEYTVVPPPPSGEERGLLAVADLPPVGRIAKPWVGTEAVVARPNPSLTTCDRANFVAAGAAKPRARTYLIPEAQLPARFGLSETIGRFRSSARAQAFLDDIRRKVAGCEDRDLATDVTSSTRRVLGPGTGYSAWTFSTEISERETIRFRIGFVKVGPQVAQLTFAPSPREDMSSTAFEALLVRAGDRLRELD